MLCRGRRPTTAMVTPWRTAPATAPGPCAPPPPGSRGGAEVVRDAINRSAEAVTSSTARLNASSLARDGLAVPLSLRTNCSADARISSSVAWRGEVCQGLDVSAHVLKLPAPATSCQLPAASCQHSCSLPASSFPLVQRRARVCLLSGAERPVPLLSLEPAGSPKPEARGLKPPGARKPEARSRLLPEPVCV